MGGRERSGWMEEAVKDERESCGGKEIWTMMNGKGRILLLVAEKDVTVTL